jgi:hypothetical protein
MIGPTEFILARIQDYAAAIKYGPCNVNFRASAKPDILIELWFVPLKKERKPIHFELTPDQAIEVREGALTIDCHKATDAMPLWHMDKYFQTIRYIVDRLDEFLMRFHGRAVLDI